MTRPHDLKWVLGSAGAVCVRCWRMVSPLLVERQRTQEGCKATGRVVFGDQRTLDPTRRPRGTEIYHL
jgi:hypothetical protein